MSTTSLTLSLLLAFVLGCAAAQLVVPRVRAGTNPTRWEYVFHDDPWAGGAKKVAAMNRLGAEGWELVGGGSLHEMGSLDDWRFKRPLP